MSANSLVAALLARGYVISPNNIHSLCGTQMYAGSGSLPAPPVGEQVQVLSDRIRVYRSQFFGDQGTRRSFWDQVTVQVFDSAEAFFDFYEKAGSVSAAGVAFVDRM